MPMLFHDEDLGRLNGPPEDEPPEWLALAQIIITFIVIIGTILLF